MSGIDIPPEYGGVVTLAALVITYVVARYTYDRVMRSKGKSSSTAPTITGDNNIVIQQIPSSLEQDRQFIEKAGDRPNSMDKSPWVKIKRPQAV